MSDDLAKARRRMASIHRQAKIALLETQYVIGSSNADSPTRRKAKLSRSAAMTLRSLTEPSRIKSASAVELIDLIEAVTQEITEHTSAISETAA